MVKAWQRHGPIKKVTVSHRAIVTKHFKLPDGRDQEFGTYYPENQIDVATVAVTSDGNVLVFRQFRPGPEKIMDELPGGDPELDEDIEVAALRELDEETGYVPRDMKYLGKLNYDAYSNAWRHYFLATGCEPNGTGARPDMNESNAEVVEISIDQLIVNAKSGKMTDPGAILLAYDTLIKLKKELMK